MATNEEQMQALADPTRRSIVERLSGGPLSVGELAHGLPVTRPAVSQHLRVLKDAGLVTNRRQGTRRLYQLDPEGLALLRAYLDALWRNALASFGDVAARPDDPEEEHK